MRVSVTRFLNLKAACRSVTVPRVTVARSAAHSRLLPFKLNLKIEMASYVPLACQLSDTTGRLSDPDGKRAQLEECQWVASVPVPVSLRCNSEASGVQVVCGAVRIMIHERAAFASSNYSIIGPIT